LWAVIYILVAATLWSTIGVASVVGGDIAVLAFTRSLVAGLIGLLVVRSFKLSSLIAGVLLGVLFSSHPPISCNSRCWCSSIPTIHSTTMGYNSVNSLR